MVAFSYSDDNVLLTTSHSIPGREITDHLGIVVADVTPGSHIGKDIAGGLRDMVGGRSKSWKTRSKRTNDSHSTS